MNTLIIYFERIFTQKLVLNFAVPLYANAFTYYVLIFKIDTMHL